MPATTPDPRNQVSSSPAPRGGAAPISTGKAGGKGKQKSYPTPWQLKMLWLAITGLSLLTLGALGVFVIRLTGQVLGFLHSFLLPVAVAAVLAYLLEPLVHKLRERNVPHKQAALLVFLAFLLGGGALVAAIAIPVGAQTRQLARNIPEYSDYVSKNLSPEGIADLVKKYEDHALLGPLISFASSQENGKNGAPATGAQTGGATQANGMAPAQVEPPFAPGQEAPGTDPVPQTTVVTAEGEAIVDDEPIATSRTVPDAEPDIPGRPIEPLTGLEDEEIAPPQNFDQIQAWLAVQIPRWAQRTWETVVRSIGGVFGAFGFILSFLLVPIYLFFFLRESHNIGANWSRYLPLRASRFKDEIVSLLQEVNQYLIAFFRGQMIVSLIDGALTAVVLSIVGLRFGLLIGVLVGILGIIPYIGIIVCYVPAVIIALVQSTQGNWGMAPNAPWWVLPLVVTATFILVNNLDGILIAPKIVGDSVGLHPLVIIASVIFWSIVLGGLLGALLAVPLTATMQVLFRRYIWQRAQASAPTSTGTDPGPSGGGYAIHEDLPPPHERPPAA